MKKKVLYVHHSGFLGGAPKSLTYLINKINRDYYQPIILTIKKGPAVKLLESTGAKVIINQKMFPFHGSTVSGMSFKLFLKNILGAIPTYFSAKKEIKKAKPDIIHLNSTCLFMVAKAAKDVSKDIKVISHVREPLLETFAGSILRIMNKKYVDKFIAIDKFDSLTIDKKGENVDIIYNFVDFNQYNASKQDNSFREKLKIPKNKVVYLYSGRVVPGNGVLEMVTTFKNASYRTNEIELVIAGFYFDNSEYEKQVIDTCKDTQNIHLLKFTDDVPTLIANSDVMIAPFREPHFSRSIIEAAAMKKPSIASNIGGPNELIINEITGFLYSPNNYKELEKYIILISKNEKLRREMGLKAEEFAKQNFDSDVNAKKTFEVYERIK
ncbi:glycosyltransferase [Paraliobacillus ryukyuensis]|uniref:glycosyltransferase n=1 Tax=Paraliobacillus ryukyuensis TaxID=200904 RepID=UPI0009A55D10|nr:glycosyltransferase [Paraliobacillus ryukyuensis]